MAVLFLTGGLVVLGFRFKEIPETIGMIFKYAFTPEALIGGGVGAALKTAAHICARIAANIAVGREVKHFPRFYLCKNLE